MLILTRHPGEAVKIGDDITVKVLRVREGRIHLGVNAPKTTRVDRAEIRERILAEQRHATGGD